MRLITVSIASKLIKRSRQVIINHIKSGNIAAAKVYGASHWGAKWHYVIKEDDLNKISNLKRGRKFKVKKSNKTSD